MNLRSLAPWIGLSIVLGLPLGCGEAPAGEPVDDTAAPTPDGAMEGDTASGPWAASPDDRGVCRTYCENVHGCLGIICPEGSFGPRAPFVEGCHAACVADPAGVDEAWALVPATCPELTTILCQTTPTVEERCACDGQVAPDGKVCGVAGVVDQLWVREGYIGCGDAPHCDVEWLNLASDGTWRRAWRRPSAPSDLPACDAGDWRASCHGVGYGILWIRSCDGGVVSVDFDVTTTELRFVETTFRAAPSFAPPAPFDVADGCEPTTSCARP